MSQRCSVGPQHGQNDQHSQRDAACRQQERQLVATRQSCLQRVSLRDEIVGAGGRDGAHSRKSDGRPDLHRHISEPRGQPCVRRRDLGHRDAQQR